MQAKVEQLKTTNGMLEGIIASKMSPAFVKSVAKQTIEVNKAKIAKIEDKRIPKLDEKIAKQLDKADKFEREIGLAQCKRDRLTSLNGVIKSFSVLNPADRRRQFSQSMDSLHKSSIELYNKRIDMSTVKIKRLTAEYTKTDNPVLKSALYQSIAKQKSIRRNSIAKRNKLLGVIVPISRQSERVQDEALKQTEKVVNTVMSSEKTMVAEVADTVAVAPLPALPEHTISEPDTSRADIERQMPEIATLMGVSVSELESKPDDIKQALVLDYNNDGALSPEEIQEQLSRLISPDSRVEEHIEEKKRSQEQAVMPVQDDTPKEKDNPLHNTEIAIEGSYSSIDGVINNVPPEKPPEEAERSEPPATISMSTLLSGAAIAEAHAQETGRAERVQKPQDLE